MKKINFKMIFFMTMLFVFTSVTTCFADIYVAPGPYFRYDLSNFKYDLLSLGIDLDFLPIIFIALLVIDIICMGVGRIIKSTTLVEKTQNIAKNLIYALLIIVTLLFSMIYAGFISTLFNIIPFIIIFASVFLRFKYKKLKASYLIMVIYNLILFLYMFIDYVQIIK